MAPRAIKDGDLHAYVDGWMEGERRLEFEALLAQDPEAAERVRAYRLQVQTLHALFDPVLSEEPDEEVAGLRDELAARLAGGTPPSRSRFGSPWMRLAAAVLLLIAGGIGGWSLRGPTGHMGPPGALQAFADEAVQAHAFYADSRFAVEMGADDPGALDTWLSQRLGRTIFGPDLSGLGFALIGGRSLPTSTGAGVQYMYEDGDSRRLTLYVSAPRGGQESAFSYIRQGEISTFYWIEGSLAYALIGALDREELMAIAQTVHHEFERDGPPAEARRAAVAAPGGVDAPAQEKPKSIQPAGAGTSKPM